MAISRSELQGFKRRYGRRRMAVVEDAFVGGN
jgi:hypothetical protein